MSPPARPRRRPGARPLRGGGAVPVEQPVSRGPPDHRGAPLQRRQPAPAAQVTSRGRRVTGSRGHGTGDVIVSCGCSSSLAGCTVLLHGPTGSGKVTALRAATRRLNLHLLKVGLFLFFFFLHSSSFSSSSSSYILLLLTFFFFFFFFFFRSSSSSVLLLLLSFFFHSSSSSSV